MYCRLLCLSAWLTPSLILQTDNKLTSVGFCLFRLMAGLSAVDGNSGISPRWLWTSLCHPCVFFFFFFPQWHVPLSSKCCEVAHVLRGDVAACASCTGFATDAGVIRIPLSKRLHRHVFHAGHRSVTQHRFKATGPTNICANRTVEEKTRLGNDLKGSPGNAENRGRLGYGWWRRGEKIEGESKKDNRVENNSWRLGRTARDTGLGIVSLWVWIPLQLRQL